MHYIQKLQTFLIWFFFSSLLLGCGGGGGGSAPPVISIDAPATLLSISVTAPESQLASGLSINFTATGLFSDGTQQNLTSQVIWAVSDATKATINAASGLLTGQAVGQVTITATKDGLTGSRVFSISSATLDRLEVSPSTLNLAKGTSQSVNVTAIFSDQSQQDVSDQVIWTSSDDTLAIIAEGSSRVEALEQGEVQLTASLSGRQADLMLTVSGATLASLSLTPVNSTIPLGLSQQYVAQATFTDGSVQDVSSQVTWLSSNESVALISNNDGFKGKADSQAVGSSTISAVLDSMQQSTTLTVDNAQLSSIDLQPTNQTIAKGSNASIRAFGSYTDGARIDITSLINWNTNSSGLIDLSLAASGTIKTLGQGDALVSAELEGITSLANIRVTDATLTSISIEAASTTLASGSRSKLTARGLFSDTTTQDISDQVIWQTSDISVLSIANGGNDFGTITGQSAGQAVITASLGEESVQETFTVTNAILESLLITSPVNSLNVNASVQASALATFSDSSTQDVTSQVNWLSDNINIASVDNTQGNKGRISALSTGVAEIRVSLNGIDSSPFEISVTQDANLPAALNLQAQPNIILNNGTDTSQISINVIPALPGGIIADGTEVTLTITEGETQRTENLTTTNGVASFTLTSDFVGVVGLSATLADLSSSSGLLSTSDLRNAIINQGISQAIYENNTLKAGSSFILLVRNLSNRVFKIDEIRIQYIDPNNGNAVQFPESPLTDSLFTSGGDLSAGEFTSVGYQLDFDIEANLYDIIYVISDDASGTSLLFGWRFDFSSPG